jgi:hypothetical protein
MLYFPFGVWLKKRLDSNDCAWTLPLPPWAPQGEHTMRRFRRLARRVLRQRRVADHGWADLVAQSLTWPAMAGLKAWLASRARATTGTRHRVHERSFLDLWWVQLAHNIRIRDQQMLAFELPEQRACVGLSIPSYEHQALMDLINRNTGPKVFEEKRGFARFCAAHNLPAVEVLAESDGSKVVQFRPLPARDLILKPSDLWAGRGVCALTFDARRGCWIGAKGELLASADIPAYAGRAQAGHPWVLQPRLRNGPAWASWSSGALSTVRVVTARETPGAPVEILGGFMRFPQGDAIVDNRTAGAISADYDRESGRLGPARGLACPRIAYSVHPDTGAAIAGEVIPAWDRVRALAQRAHAPISEIAMIGWDVAMPADEPILLEMNLNWGIFNNTPFGSTRYMKIVHNWLDTPEVAAFKAAVLKA